MEINQVGGLISLLMCCPSWKSIDLRMNQTSCHLKTVDFTRVRLYFGVISIPCSFIYFASCYQRAELSITARIETSLVVPPDPQLKVWDWNLRSSERRIDPSVAKQPSNEQLSFGHNSSGQYVGRPFLYLILGPSKLSSPTGISVMFRRLA